jgi:hypothetical protein
MAVASDLITKIILFVIVIFLIVKLFKKLLESACSVPLLNFFCETSKQLLGLFGSFFSCGLLDPICNAKAYGNYATNVWKGAATVGESTYNSIKKLF